MLGALVVLAAIVTAGAAITWAVYYLSRENSRTKQEQESRFRAAALLQLRKKGPSSLDFDRLVEESEVPVEAARQAAATLYAGYCEKALADAQVTESERRQLESLRRALAISAEAAADIEAKARDERYRDTALGALADGKITKEEAAELERLRDRLGLSAQQALELVKTPARDGYLALFRRVISEGRIAAEELEELRRYREALGISRGEANDIVRDDVMGLYRQWFYNIMQDGEVTIVDPENWTTR